MRVVALCSAWVTAFVLVLLGLVEAVQTGSGDAVLLSALTTLLVISTVTVGAVLVSRLPHHIVGWLLLTGGLVAAVSTAAGALADYALNVHPGAYPGAIWFAVLANATSGIYLGLLGGFAPLYFPSGRLPSPRWRPVVAIGFVATFVPVVTGLLGPIPSGTYPPEASNPLELGGIGGQLVALLGVVSTVSGLVALVLVVVSLVVRYRSARGVERAQIKWFAYVGLIVVPTLVIAIATSSATSGAWVILTTVAWAVAVGGLALLPVTIGVAILRYRLYEIDRLISRTISWTVVTVVLGSTFFLVILTAQALIAPVTGSNELVVAGSTLIVAALFQPIRRRVQRLVDRRFNRARYDADRTINAFAARLRDEVDLEQLRVEILTTVNQVVEPTAVSLWLRA